MLSSYELHEHEADLLDYATTISWDLAPEDNAYVFRRVIRAFANYSKFCVDPVEHPNTPFQAALERLGACDEARGWVGSKTLDEAWRACDESDWMKFLLAKCKLDLDNAEFAECEDLSADEQCEWYRNNRTPAQLAKALKLTEKKLYVFYEVEGYGHLAVGPCANESFAQIQMADIQTYAGVTNAHMAYVEEPI